MLISHDNLIGENEREKNTGPDPVVVIMPRSANQHYFDQTGCGIQIQGGYGVIDFIENKRSELFVKKVAKVNCLGKDLQFKAALTKEAILLLWMQRFPLKHHTPRCSQIVCGYEHVEGHRVIMVREIYMEFLGPSLEICTSLGFLIEPYTLMKGLFEAYSWLSRFGILHLDLKPGNVTYDLDTCQVKLIDLGMSEMVGYMHLDKVAGLRKWNSSPPSPLAMGEVTKEGIFAGLVPTGTLYCQSKFYHHSLRATQMNRRLNVAGYGDPLYMTCHELGVSSGILVDSKVDIMAIGMIVFTHILSRLPIAKINVDHKVQLLEYIRAITTLRGTCKFSEALLFRLAVIRCAEVCEKPLDQSFLEIVFHELKGGASARGIYDSLTYNFGKATSELLLLMIHPLPSRRPTIEICSQKLEGAWQHKATGTVAGTPDLSTRLTVHQDIYIGQVFNHSVCVLSLVVRMYHRGRGDILWLQKTSSYRTLLTVKIKRSICLRLVSEIHLAVGCCKKHDHAVLWYSSLSSNKALIDLKNNLLDLDKRNIPKSGAEGIMASPTLR